MSQRTSAVPHGLGRPHGMPLSARPYRRACRRVLRPAQSGDGPQSRGPEHRTMGSPQVAQKAPPTVFGDGGGGQGPGESGGGDSGDGGDDTNLTFNQVEAFLKERDVNLPSDMMSAARQGGLRLSVLRAFMGLRGASALLARTVPFFRDRILADPKFLFVVAAELAIDTGCTTVAEVRKRGSSFWDEFELFLSDLVVGLVMDVVLISLMAPVAVVGGAGMAVKASGLDRLLSTVPSAVFAASVPGVRTYGLGQRLSCLLVKFCEYSLAGMACGLVGQGVANAAMEANRAKHGAAENAVPVPPLLKTALVWGLFMGVSSNLRYQAVFGIERLVDLTLARRIPQLAYGTTVICRFANNVIGGENFIDIARWAGVQ